MSSNSLDTMRKMILLELELKNLRFRLKSRREARVFDEPDMTLEDDAHDRLREIEIVKEYARLQDNLYRE